MGTDALIELGRRALLARISSAPTTEAIVERVISLFADIARRLWPIWFTNVSFAGCRNDRLGQLAAGAIARKAAGEIAGLSAPWAEAAALLVLNDAREGLADRCRVLAVIGSEDHDRRVLQFVGRQFFEQPN
jgi:hypothetical protein